LTNKKDLDLNVSNHLIGLVDILFAVAVGGSFPKLVFNYSDISISSLPSHEAFFAYPNMALFIAYYMVILSWIGYHSMIEKFPYRYKTLTGIARFMEDVFIVFIYIILMYSRKDSNIFIFWLIIIFILYGLNDCFRASEHNKFDNQVIKSYLFATLLFSIWAFFFIFSKGSSYWFPLILAFIIITIYRFSPRVEDKYALWGPKCHDSDSEE